MIGLGRRCSLGVLTCVLLALVATGCGVPRDDTPRAIPAGELPIDLVEGQQPSSDTPLSPDATDFQIWMVGADNKLTTVARAIPRTPDAVLTALLNGTTPDERALGITSAITRGTNAMVLGVQEDRIAFVDLTEGSLQGIAATEQELAFAQMVYSLTGLIEIDSVLFTIDGEAISFRIDGGATNPGQAVNRTDFESLIRTRPNFGAEEDGTDGGPVPAPTVTPVADPPANTTELSVWMISPEGFLVPVVRRIELSEEALLASLLLGARTEEREDGLRSAIPPDAVAINVDVDEAAATAIVDLAPGSLPGLPDNERMRAVGQIVYTLTGLFAIDHVIISVDGQREPMPTDRGITEPGQPLGRGDFASLAPSVAPLPVPASTPTPG